MHDTWVKSFLLLLFIPLFASGQNLEQEPASTAYQQFTLSLQPQYDRASKITTLQHFEAAYGWSKRKNRMFELGLNNISVDAQKIYYSNQQLLTDPIINKQRSLGLNVIQYFYLKPNRACIQPYAGAGWESLLNYSTHEPGSSRTSFEKRSTIWSNRLFFIPGIQLSLSSFLIKLEVPVTLIWIDLDQSRVKNPAIPFRSQNHTMFDASFLPFNFMAIELGIGYRIHK